MMTQPWGLTNPDPPLPLLITGGAGVAGYNALHYFRGKFQDQVVGIHKAILHRRSEPGIVACNAEDQSALAELFRRHRFRSVLNCAGNCALKACELDRELAWLTNVTGVENILAQVRQYDARLVHLSCDLVFSGDGSGLYTEDMPTDPVTVYGETMVQAENRVLKQCPEACILRISLPMGISPGGHAGAIDWIAHRFRHGRVATLYFDEIRTPTYCDCLSMLCEAILATDTAGLFHAGGPRQLSLFEIAQIINRIGGYDPDLLDGIPRIQAGPTPPRAGNVTMVSERLIQKLGCNPFDPWPLDDAMVPTDRLWHHNRPASEGRGEQVLHQLLAINPRRRTESR